MIARIFWLLLILLGWWLLRRIFLAGRTRPAEARGRRGSQPQVGEAMVRDRVCNTFLPRSRAIVLRDGVEEHFFCSENCRSTFLAMRNDRG